MSLENGKSIFRVFVWRGRSLLHVFTPNFGEPVCIVSVVILLYNDKRASLNLFSPLEICSKYQHQYDTRQFLFALFFNQSRNKDAFNLVSFSRIEAIRL